MSAKREFFNDSAFRAYISGFRSGSLGCPNVFGIDPRCYKCERYYENWGKRQGYTNIDEFPEQLDPNVCCFDTDQYKDCPYGADPQIAKLVDMKQLYKLL